MASPGGTGDAQEPPFDPSQPFRGVVICCTSIPPEQRSDIGQKTQELGGLHKYDLTPDCTHLIVGEYDTPKYRHVAKERPDVKVMSAHWVNAVRDLWIQDADIDFAALEKEWQLKVFETTGGEPFPDNTPPERGRLMCCMTGFEDPVVRQDIAQKIQSNGGEYTGDLSKKVTHLIVYKPEGRKYQAAKNWGIHTVSLEWVHDSVERGLILDERCYNPILPPAERGVGAWNRDSIRRIQLGKRLREAAAANPEEGRRKLRKTASIKFNSQRENLWGDILNQPQAPALEPAPVPAPAPAPLAGNRHNTAPQQSAGQQSTGTQGTKMSSFGVHDESVIFASCCFYTHGFEQKRARILSDVIGSLGGLICRSLDEVVSASGAQLAHRFLIVPQDSPSETHPVLPDNVHVATEFYIERCMHNKYFFDPAAHVVGRPFPIFPIPGFEKLFICTAGFTGVDLNQVDKTIRQLGGKYDEKFTAQASVLVCSSLDKVRKQKLDLALAWQVPIVRADWLWECISTGLNVPVKGHLFPELRQKFSPSGSHSLKDKSRLDMTGRSAPAPAPVSIDSDLLPKAQAKSKKTREFDVSGFVSAFKDTSDLKAATEPAVPTEKRSHSTVALQEHESNATTHFETAPTHQLDINSGSDSQNNSGSKSTASAPLSEASTNSLNKAPRSPRKQAKKPKDGTPTPHPPPQSQTQQKQPPRKPMSRVTSEIADSEATDGDFGMSDDVPVPSLADDDQIPRQQQQQQQHKKERQDVVDVGELERRRIEAEKEAERLAISTKFASLLDLAALPAAAADSHANEDLVPTIPLAGRSLSRVFSGAGSGGSTTATRRRKREIFGRAISNVSAASSGSADSATSNNPATTTSGGGGVVAQPSTPATSATAVLPDRNSNNDGDTSDDPTATTTTTARTTDSSKLAVATQPPPMPPSGTQLEYKDPEANLHKQKLMHKMLGTVSGGKPAPFVADQQEEKLTLAELGGYERQYAGQNQRQYGGRVTRRRGGRG